MSELDLLERAIAIAIEAHRGKKDRYGAPYILHPLRVMHQLDTPAEQTVGILHDVVEDTEWSFEDLRKEGYPESILDALKAVTKQEGEDYDDFVRRSAANPLARKVKLADLRDNMDLRRFPDVKATDLKRLEKYVKAWRFLVGQREVE